MAHLKRPKLSKKSEEEWIEMLDLYSKILLDSSNEYYLHGDLIEAVLFLDIFLRHNKTLFLKLEDTYIKKLLDLIRIKMYYTNEMWLYKKLSYPYNDKKSRSEQVADVKKNIKKVEWKYLQKTIPSYNSNITPSFPSSLNNSISSGCSDFFMLLNLFTTLLLFKKTSFTVTNFFLN